MTHLELGSLASALLEVSAESYAVTYDLSFPVLGIEPEYGDVGDDEDWTVLVACEAPEHAGVAFGVIPDSAVTPAIEADVRAGRLRWLLVECGES